MQQSAKIPNRFYLRGTLEVARDLLGRVLCRRIAGGKVIRGSLVEVEAYDGPSDRACHASRGKTQRNSPMFEAGGIAYVYQIYGVHFCLNVVTGDLGFPAAVLLRGAELPDADPSATGPGRLCRAFQIDRSQDRASMLGPELWLERGVAVPDGQVKATERIGVDYAGWWARRDYRFVVGGHPAVSGPRRMR